MSSRTRWPKSRPHIIYPDAVLFVARHFNAIAGANNGRLPSVSLLDERIAKSIEADPTLLNPMFIARSLRKRWEKANHKVISKDGEVVFIPSAAITVARGLRVRMDSLQLPLDMLAWGETEQRARVNYNRTMDGRDAYRKLRLKESALHPELPTLGEVERALHGYVPGTADETPFTTAPIESEDEEDFEGLFDDDEDETTP